MAVGHSNRKRRVWLLDTAKRIPDRTMSEVCYLCGRPTSTVNRVECDGRSAWGHLKCVQEDDTVYSRDWLCPLCDPRAQNPGDHETAVPPVSVSSPTNVSGTGASTSLSVHYVQSVVPGTDGTRKTGNDPPLPKGSQASHLPIATSRSASRCWWERCARESTRRVV